MSWQLTGREARKGANFIDYADRLGSSIFQRIGLSFLLSKEY